ncbi:hypothetical protein T484DRAFT_1776589 [Baffinella frigidus]|nr:hypothetical protein T484DRAFT_1776589 [Cryptophyta sp. CCMP2293]
MWGLGKMGVTPDAGLMKAMQRRAIATMRHFKPLDLANLWWALSSMGVKLDAPVLRAMEGQAPFNYPADVGLWKPMDLRSCEYLQGYLAHKKRLPP